jgi:uncharacterized cupin superfamily protein
MADGYTIKSIDEFEEMEGSGGATWRLARKTLGAKAFGFNVVDIEAGGQIPAHDHTGDDQEEVFIILEGEGTIVTDDEEHDAPAGTFCRFAPEINRTIQNKSDSTVRALLIGVPIDSGYKRMPWG